MGTLEQRLSVFTADLTGLSGNGKSPRFPVRKEEAWTLSAQQADLFGLENDGRSAGRVSMGNFFEALSEALYGGRRFDSRIYEDDHVRPDVINVEGGVVVEAKACRYRSTGVPLRDDQMNRLRLVQESNPEAAVRLVVYRHSFEGIGSYDDGDRRLPERALYEYLASDQFFAVDIDFPVADALHDVEDSTEWVYRYPAENDRKAYHPDAKRWERCSSIRDKTLNRLASDPWSVLGDLGLDEYGPLVQRFKVPVVSVDGLSVGPFPLVRVGVQDRAAYVADHRERWRDLRKQHEEFLRECARYEAEMRAEEIRAEGARVGEELVEEMADEVYQRELLNDGSLSSQVPDQHREPVAAGAVEDDLPF